MALLEHRLEQHQQVQVGAGKINPVQHVGEIISMDSSGGSCDLYRPSHFDGSNHAHHTTQPDGGRGRRPSDNRRRRRRLHPEAAAATGSSIDELMALSLESNTVLMRGDIVRYRELVTQSADFTLMSPFGGAPACPRHDCRTVGGDGSLSSAMAASRRSWSRPTPRRTWSCWRSSSIAMWRLVAFPCSNGPCA